MEGDKVNYIYIRGWYFIAPSFESNQTKTLMTWVVEHNITAHTKVQRGISPPSNIIKTHNFLVFAAGHLFLLRCNISYIPRPLGRKVYFYNDYYTNTLTFISVSTSTCSVNLKLPKFAFDLLCCREREFSLERALLRIKK